MATKKTTPTTPISYSDACKHVWEDLKSIDCKDHVEDKYGLTYLSWVWAYSMMMDRYPDFTYHFDPVYFDENSGTSEVSCTVAVGYAGHVIKKTMWLPVMYIPSKRSPPKGKVTPDCVDINTAKMRCLTKAISMLGLGAYIYAGEDVPSTPPEPERTGTLPEYTPPPDVAPDPVPPATTSNFQTISDPSEAANVATMMILLAETMHSSSMDDLRDFWNKNKATLESLKTFPDEHDRVRNVFNTIRSNLLGENQ
jgi:hypothetical protein